MIEINEKVENFLKRERSDRIVGEYRKLINFIDGAVSQAFNLTGDERAQFLVKNLLNMRDFLSSEVVLENYKSSICDHLTGIIDLETNSYEWTKKKEEEEKLEEEQPLPESLSETGQEMLHKIEEREE